MIELSYSLTKDEMLDYYQMILSGASETKVAKLITLVWGPLLFIAIVLALKLVKIYQDRFLLIVAILSIAWVLISYPILFKKVCRQVANKKYKFDESKVISINVKEENGNFKVNGQEKVLQNYYGYNDLLVVTFTDASNLIVPGRVFNNDENLMKQFIKDIMLKLDNKHGII